MHELIKNKLVDNYLECFGALNLDDPICRKHCALRLKCAIEQVEQNRLIQLEDLINVQEEHLKEQ